MLSHNSSSHSYPRCCGTQTQHYTTLSLSLAYCTIWYHNLSVDSIGALQWSPRPLCVGRLRWPWRPGVEDNTHRDSSESSLQRSVRIHVPLLPNGTCPPTMSSQRGLGLQCSGLDSGDCTRPGHTHWAHLFANDKGFVGFTHQPLLMFWLPLVKIVDQLSW